VAADQEPGRRWQWTPTDPAAANLVPDAHDPAKRHAPMMTTADMALRMDPIYGPISKRFHENPDQFADAFARAWFKLTHRDMGPKVRYLGPLVPAEDLIWQDPVPPVTHPLVDEADIAALKARILGSGPFGLAARRDRLGLGLDLPRLGPARRRERRAHPPRAAARLGGEPASAARHRAGEAGGDPGGLQRGGAGRQAGVARDLIVLGGCAAVEAAARSAGHEVTVAFAPGRTDATQEQTDVDSFAALEPTADGFRNYLRTTYSISAEELLVDRAQLLTLTAPEMTVLVGGLRVLGANTGQSPHGVFTQRPGVLTNDFFVNLLDMGTAWRATSEAEAEFEGRDRQTGAVRWTGTRVDLVFGSNSQLRAIAEVYAQADAKAKFVRDFVSAWTKVMNLDRFDLA
jgi:catalase-peroxidase